MFKRIIFFWLLCNPAETVEWKTTPTPTVDIKHNFDEDLQTIRINYDTVIELVHGKDRSFKYFRGVIKKYLTKKQNVDEEDAVQWKTTGIPCQYVLRKIC